MIMDSPSEKDLLKELIITATRSSGPGGQNVNKVSTRIELRFDVNASAALSDEQKDLLRNRLATRVTKDGILRVVSQTERTQLENREKAIGKFIEIIRKALAPVKKRIKTQPTKSSKLKRLEYKNHVSQKKEGRRSVYKDD